VHLAEPLDRVPDELAPFSAKLEGGGRTLFLAPTQQQRDGELLTILCRLGLNVTELSTEQAGLEEVFLELTGLRPNGRKEP
jgi:ABC-2 type transport system ATP-binding protein